MSNPKVELHRRHGVITLELDQDKAPVRRQLLAYVNKIHYNNTIFIA
jgi:cyclophilin family peptidyl-prolyl cis-trans isomerase